MTQLCPVHHHLSLTHLYVSGGCIQCNANRLEESIPVWPGGEKVTQQTFDILREQHADEQRAHANTQLMLEQERDIARHGNEAPELNESLENALDEWWNEDHFGEKCSLGDADAVHSEECVSAAFKDGYSAGRRATGPDDADEAYDYGGKE